MMMRALPHLSLVLALGLLTTGCGRAVIAPAVAAGPSSERQGVSESAGPDIPEVLRKEVHEAERLMAKQVAFKRDLELDAYLQSVVKALPASSYDRNGFLASLGLKAIAAPGRQDVPTLDAVRQVEGFRPGTMVGDHEVLPQVLAFKIAMAKPALFLKVIPASNAAVEALSRQKALWKRPFTPRQVAQPTGETPEGHYPVAMAALPSRFDADFHSGIPPLDAPDAPSYGTYGIARSMGFTDTQARRLALMCVGVDGGKTPYGKTGPAPTAQMDRHFNLDRAGQDTRFIWAQRHLDAAKSFGRQTAYDQAEVELGCGLHSLQDAFAHGQLTPSMHGVIGEFPDDVTYDPIAFYEATGATVAYLRAYLRALKDDATPSSAVN